MKKKIALLLAALLVLTGAVAVSAGNVEDEDTTTATIRFKDGSLSFDGENNEEYMNISFGEHELPVKETDYYNENLNTLGIADARQVAGDWQVTVSRTGTFTANTDDVGGISKFEGELVLIGGKVWHSGGDEIDLGDVNVVEEIVVGKATENDDDQTALVITAGKGQNTGTFYVDWEAGRATDEGGVGIKLTISGEEAANLVIEHEYVENIFWTLEVVEE